MQELLYGAFRVTVLGLNRRTVCISVCRRQRLTANPSLLLSRMMALALRRGRGGAVPRAPPRCGRGAKEAFLRDRVPDFDI